MVAVGRVLLWTVALVAPGGFLLVPVLVLQSGGGPSTLRERLTQLTARVRGALAALQHYWTKS
jgi:hypothetical protein